MTALDDAAWDAEIDARQWLRSLASDAFRDIGWPVGGVSALKPSWIKDKYGTSYREIVESWGFDVIEFDTHGSYQGDHTVLLRSDNRFGFGVIGYGSCSGCDALEAAEPWDENGDWQQVIDLASELKSAIHWADASDFRALIEGLDSANHWWLHDDEVSAAIRGYVQTVEAAR